MQPLSETDSVTVFMLRHVSASVLEVSIDNDQQGHKYTPIKTS